MKGTVVITGATKGLGRETALAFGRAGYFVLGLYSSDASAAQKLEAALAADGSSGCTIRHDVTTENNALWDRTEILQAESLILIHNACAPFSPVPMHQLPWTEFETGFRVAVKGGWWCAQSLIRPMLKSRRGTIVNILTSALDAAPPKGFGAYVTAKHALRGLTLALAAEYAPRGVRVFSASPGYMNTALTAGWDPRFQEAIQSGASRVSDPAEAARRLRELVESADVPGRGEDYPI